MLTKSQFLQALRDTQIGQDADPIGTLYNLSEGTAAVDFDVAAQAGGIVVSATVTVDVKPDGKKKAGDEDTIDIVTQTGFAILSSTGMVDVEKAEQNAVRNAINLMGGIAEYIPVAAPINAVVTRPMAQPAAAAPQNGNGVVAQAQAVATAAAGGPVCDQCGTPFTPFQGKFGPMSPEQVAAWSRKRNNGRALCNNCYKK